jgi:hypothetical protein
MNSIPKPAANARNETHRQFLATMFKDEEILLNSKTIITVVCHRVKLLISAKYPVNRELCKIGFLCTQ